MLFTLLQAVKAIKGGVIAIKGQLLKGGGHLLTAKGKLIRGGGEALTTIGKSIALSAFHLMPESHEDDEGIIHEAPGMNFHLYCTLHIISFFYTYTGTTLTLT